MGSTVADATIIGEDSTAIEAPVPMDLWKLAGAASMSATQAAATRAAPPKAGAETRSRSPRQ